MISASVMKGLSVISWFTGNLQIPFTCDSELSSLSISTSSSFTSDGTLISLEPIFNVLKALQVAKTFPASY